MNSPPLPSDSLCFPFKYESIMNSNRNSLLYAWLEKMVKTLLHGIYRSSDTATLIIAFIIRLLVAPFTGHPYDLPILISVGRLVAELRSPYDITRTIGYPGIWPIWLGVAFALAANLFSGNSYVYTLIFKIPIIATDFAIPVLVSALIRQVRAERED